jgi:hypothetical protein
MSGGRWLLHAGEFLVGRAARHLPAAARDERYQEWAAELPVILRDPETKPAAARAARMLWFAADTLRGAALGPGLARRRGAHRGGAGKTARWLGEGAALLAALAVLLAILAFGVYQAIFGMSLAFQAACLAALLLGSLAILAVGLLRRRPGGAGRYWFSAGVAAQAASGGAALLAPHLGWDHPLLFTLIAACGCAVWAACISVAAATVIRSARRDRRPGMPERSAREQLHGPARAVRCPGNAPVTGHIQTTVGGNAAGFSCLSPMAVPLWAKPGTVP